MQYDAAIIGAGPAGATFARRLAQQSPELKILLLDAQDEGHKKPCGGLLAPDAQKTLAHFDLVLPKSVLADPQIFAVETMDLRTRRVRYYQRYISLSTATPSTAGAFRSCRRRSRSCGGAARPCRERTGASSSPCGRRRALGRSPAAASSARTARGPSCARPFSTGPSTDICRCSSGSARRTRLSLFIPASLIPKPVKAARG